MNLYKNARHFFGMECVDVREQIFINQELYFFGEFEHKARVLFGNQIDKNGCIYYIFESMYIIF
jgi:hypothetical protein